MRDQDLSTTDPRYDSGYQASAGAGKLGMAIFLVVIGALFAAGLIAYVVVRLRAPEWPPPGSPSLGIGLWVSTAVLLLSSVALHMAYEGAKNDRQGMLRNGLVATTALGLLFLLCQIGNWTRMAGYEITAGGNLYSFTFFVLTGLHALHVLGGIVQLVYVTVRARRGAYSSSFYPGVLYSAMYWHFLTVIWMVIFTVLVLAGGGEGA